MNTNPNLDAWFDELNHPLKVMRFRDVARL